MIADKSSKYDALVAKYVTKWVKRFKVQTKRNILDSFDPISITEFLSTFKIASDTNGLHGGAVMRLILFFMENSAAAALNYRVVIS